MARRSHGHARLVITYDGLDLVVYDGVRSAHTMRLGLGTAAFAPLFSRYPRASYVYSLLYSAIVFLFAGAPISRACASLRQFSLRIAAVAAGIVACSFAFESMQVVASGRLFSSNVFWTITFAATCAAIAATGAAARQLRSRQVTAPST